MTRTHARALRGKRAVGKVPVNFGPNITLVVGIGLRRSRPLAPMMFAGSMTGSIWNHYVENCLAPQLRRGDVVAFDGLGAHRTARARAAIEARGARVDMLPPYSPDLSPVESCGSKIKTIMRAAGARTFRRLVNAAGRAIAAVTPKDVRGWFGRAGYLLPPGSKPP